MENYQILTIIGIFLTALGLIATSAGTYLSRDKMRSSLNKITEDNIELKSKAGSLQTINNNQLESIEILKTNNKELIKKNDKQLSDLRQLRKANIRLSEELIEQTKELTNQVTGGEEYAHILLRHDKQQKKFIVTATLDANSKYAMYDVKFRLYNTIDPPNILVKDFAAKPYKKAPNSECRFCEDFGTLPTGAAYDLGSFNEPKENFKGFKALVFAKNGVYKINMLLFKEKGEWIYKSVTFDRNDENRVVKTISIKQ